MKKRVVVLAAVVEALEMQFEERRMFLDRDTGEIHDLGLEELTAAENDDDVSQYLEWQQPLIEVARQVFSDSSGRYVELPDQWELNEYRALERFSTSQADPVVTDQLLSAIRGTGAFRRFKDALHRLGLAESWYAYRRDYLREIARDWCEANDIRYTNDSA